MELSKNDWKLFRERLPGWQERYMDKLTREYAEFLTDDSRQPSERFWALNKRIREDRRKPGVQLELRKQNVVFDLTHLIGMAQFRWMSSMASARNCRIWFVNFRKNRSKNRVHVG